MKRALESGRDMGECSREAREPGEQRKVEGTNLEGVIENEDQMSCSKHTSVYPFNV